MIKPIMYNYQISRPRDKTKWTEGSSGHETLR